MRGKVPNHAVHQIQQMIVRGEIKPGELLPPQRQLSEQLNVSRASLREALSVLETLGFVRIEPGRGTFVADGSGADRLAPNEWRFSDRFSEHEVYQSRFVLEGYAVRLAAMRLTDEQLAELRQNVDDFKAAVRHMDLVTGSQKDFEFHQLIMGFCGNRLFAEMHRSFRTILMESQRLPLSNREKVWEAVVEHERILHALEQRDPDGASYYMHMHITRAADRIGVTLTDSAKW